MEDDGEGEGEVAREAPIRAGGSDESDDETVTTLVDRLPISHEVVMKEHNKVTAQTAL